MIFMFFLIYCDIYMFFPILHNIFVLYIHNIFTYTYTFIHNILHITCVSAPPSASNCTAPKKISSTRNKNLIKTFLLASSIICLLNSVLIIPGWREFEVTPVPLNCLDSSFENKMFASLL